MVKPKSRYVLIVALAIPILVAGCTSLVVPDADDAVLTPTAQASPVFPAEGLPDGATGAKAVPYDVPNDAEARKSTSVTGCVRINGGWAMTGTMSNASSKDASFDVTVFFSTPQATVLATGKTTVDAPSQETTEWRVEASFDAPQDVRCVLRGVGVAD
ncbi:hypothetical protein [Clavibacter sp. VKM Ac-2872]|uniref:hypothetical protein n=1 Tax=Clavibacter sp. VKM Ac-2872 TaxID=2783812 RepID=UPI00188C3ECD|nr:hypothetical protein [Clavibacter sp. VKM Ac-2872]MBF4625760.1 hypothetical protein [Clavibacter sp. VKM Ac-2872]